MMFTRRFVWEIGILKAVISKEVIFEKNVNLIDIHQARGKDNKTMEMPG